jgi:SAM-dependent methyltransferase
MDETTLVNERELLAKLWTVCEQLLHTDDYKKSYANWLSEALLHGADRSITIMDTAAGVGFPSRQLLAQGFPNIWCSDAAPDLLKSLIANGEDLEKTAPVLCLKWQDLSHVIMSRFDAVLCLDASIGFMDSWGAEEMVSGPDAICERVREVLRNFYTLTKPGGRFFIGLQKNNNRGNTERYVMPVGKAKLDGHTATATWDMRYDWPARRKTWLNQVEYQGKLYKQTRCSYLFDKHELAGFLRDVGFIDATEIQTPDFFYEDVIVAQRGGHV